jgi:capsular exopolysaccharide synthesis family protein
MTNIMLEQHLAQYLDVLKRRMWVGIFTFALVIAFTSWRLLTTEPEYLATAKIVIEPDFSQIMLPENTAYIDSYYLETVNLETELQILKSRTLSENVVETLGLASRNDEKNFKDMTNFLMGSISVDKVTDSRIIKINVVHNNPEMAQKIANTLVDVYINKNIEKKIASYRDSLSWMNEQLIDLKKKVEASEMNLLNYVEKEKIIVPARGYSNPSHEDTSPYSPEQSELLQELNNELVKAEIEYNKLLLKYKQKYPAVQKLNAEIESIKKKIEEEKQKIIENSKKGIKYSIMKRDVDLNKELYNAFMKKLKELDIAAEVKKSNVSVLEYASKPEFPIKPKKKIVLLVSIFAGVILGISAAFVQEYLDRTIWNEEQVQKFIGIPVLGVIPHLAGDNEDNIPIITSYSLTSTEAELYRILRTNLKLSQLGKHSTSILITSTAPVEGKSTNSINLAITFAQTGGKTLLIDADLRRPIIHKVFNVPLHPGLTEILIGDITSYNKAIIPVAVNNLFLLPAGTIPPNPSELLESGKFPELLKYASENFDQIIIDSAPIGMVSDTTIIANMVDGVVVVMHAGKTDRFIASKAVQLLKKNKIHIYGAILNNMQKENIYKSYYYYYYYTQYGTQQDTITREARSRS